MKLDKTNLQKVARLARLSISPAEEDELARRIADTLALIDQMKSVDTAGVRPLAHPLDMTQRLRADRVIETETEADPEAKTKTATDRRDALQALAPATENGLYLVPKVIE